MKHIFTIFVDTLLESFSVLLQLSACLANEFTCQNGKCVNMESRCDNVEVNTMYISLKLRTSPDESTKSLDELTMHRWTVEI